MHGLSFGFKRAHLRAVAVHLPLARKFGLTPARFDVMFAIWEENGCAMQSGIARQLGLSPTTICKMLKVMEAVGLVERSVHLGDLRQRWVMFTKRGFECFTSAMDAFVRGDVLRDFYDALHEEGRAFVQGVARAARFVADKLGDGARQWYPDSAPDKFTKMRDDERSQTILGKIARRAALEREQLFLGAGFLAAAGAFGAARSAEDVAAATTGAMNAACAAAAARGLAPPTAEEVDLHIRISSTYWDKVNERRYRERMAAAARAEGAAVRAEGAAARPDDANGDSTVV